MSHIIITESHKAIREEIKEILGLKCLSFTFLPAFTQSTKLDIKSMEDVFLRVSNIKVMKMDGYSKFDLQNQYQKKYAKNVIPMILDLDNGKDIILAQDNDAGGNLMASVLYHKLIANGIPSKRIKRVIGIELVSRDEEYAIDIYGAKFMPYRLTMRILDRFRFEQMLIPSFRSIDKRLGKGFRNIVSLDTAISHSYYEEYIERRSKGISLATYYTKRALDEKE